MIDYETYCEIRRLQREEGLSSAKIAKALNVDVKTVYRWSKCSRYRARKGKARPSKLECYHSQIMTWLNQYDYSTAQVLTKLRELGYSGGSTILGDFIRRVRPKTQRAYHTLHFQPGQCAQVDWAEAGTISIGSTRRKLYFFALVLAHSRMLYIEFTLAQSMEHFLHCHQRAWETLGGVPREVMVDNCKVAVLRHPAQGPVVYNPRYLDFAQHYGFAIKACKPRQPQQKGRVENTVAYVKKNFLAGREIHSLESLNAEGRHWLDQVANVRKHGSTGDQPLERFSEEKKILQALPIHPYDTGVLSTVRVNKQYRIHCDGNTYSVPPQFVRQHLTLKLYPNKLRLYHENQLVAEHPRNYDRRQDREDPDHRKPLIAKATKQRDQRLLIAFLKLSPQAEAYYQALQDRKLNATIHLRKIMALAEVYGHEALARALEDAHSYQAYSSEYILNLLEQRTRKTPEPGPLHVPRREDLLDLELPEPDLNIYS